MSGCQKTLLETPSVSEPILTVSEQNRILKDSFFAHSELLSLPLRKVVQNLKDQDSVSNFITAAWVSKNGLPVWGKILSSTSHKPTMIGSRGGGNVSDISFIPLRDTLSGIIKSYIAVYHLENDAFGYRLYNRDSVTLFVPANPTEKPKVVRMLAIYAYFEQTVNNRAETFIPQPYNITFRNIQISIGSGGSVITARTDCHEVCIEGEGIISPIALVAGRLCWNVCVYGANEPNFGSSSCALCGSSGWTGSSTGGGNGSSSSSLTYLDGLISESTFLSDLSSTLDLGGFPETEFIRKFPYYVYLIAPLRQLRMAMYNPNIGIDLTDLALFVRNPAIITQLNTFLSQGGSVADGVLHKNLLKDNIDYFNANKNLGFPAIGTNAWVEALNIFTPTENPSFWDLTSEEKTLCSLYPKIALKILPNKKIAEQKTKDIMGHSGHNDKSDAFRHAYFNALNALYAGRYYANLFGEAHETNTPLNKALEKQMDLFNNSVGQYYGENVSPLNPDTSPLEVKIKRALDNGELRYLKPLDQNNEIIPGITQIVPTNQ